MVNWAKGLASLAESGDETPANARPVSQLEQSSSDDDDNFDHIDKDAAPHPPTKKKSKGGVSASGTHDSADAEAQAPLRAKATAAAALLHLQNPSLVTNSSSPTQNNNNTNNAMQGVNPTQTGALGLITPRGEDRLDHEGDNQTISRGRVRARPIRHRRFRSRDWPRFVTTAFPWTGRRVKASFLRNWPCSAS